MEEPAAQGTITFLFTDIEGSTRLWEQHPEAMRVALARPEALLTEGIQQHGGMVVKSRGEGDSVFAVFARPHEAVAAACAVQQALASEPWPAETPLRVRMALHTDTADFREGDYYGPGVNRCARLRAAAHGGQILLSLAMEEAVRGHFRPAPVCGTWANIDCEISLVRNGSFNCCIRTCSPTSRRSARSKRLLTTCRPN